ncbi:MAG: LysE family translocator [Desulfobulbaceae bacterium]|nr:MAG: LysE family translocator [Desulfobulbaceae bacterium]
MEFLLIASAHFLALVSPGPDFFLIVQASLRMPLRYVIALCAGIAVANGIYLGFAIAGLELIRDTGWLLLSLKYAGAAYLLFLGYLLLRSPKQQIENKGSKRFLDLQRLDRQFIVGFMAAILNPKNAIFYLSLFTAMVSPETSITTRYLYGLWMMMVVFIWDCGVGLVIGRGGSIALRGNGIYYVEKLSGCTLAAFGIFLPFI